VITTKKSGRNFIKFPFEFFNIRTFKQNFHDMINKQHGFKSIIEFYRLESFDLVNSFVIDVMHNILIGVFNTIIDAMSNKNSKFYSKKSERTIISNYCKKIKLPLNYHKNIYNYQGKAFNNLIIILYGYKLFKFLNPEYFKLLKNLHKIIKIIFSPCILKESINKIGVCLIEFLSDYEINFGEENMNHNIHLINHLKLNIINHGPSLFINMFKYESFNKDLNNSIRNNNNFEKRLFSVFNDYDIFLNENTILSEIEIKINNLYKKKNLNNIKVKDGKRLYLKKGDFIQYNNMIFKIKKIQKNSNQIIGISLKNELKDLDSKSIEFQMIKSHSIFKNNNCIKIKQKYYKSINLSEIL